MGAMIGDRIKAARAARGWTQKELAQRSGINFGYIRMLETNQRPNPTGDTLQRLADALGITVDELRNGPRDPAGGDEAPPLDQLRAVGWPEARLAVLAGRWGHYSPDQRRRWGQRARALYAEREQITEARRLLAEIAALNAELDQIDAPGDEQDGIYPSGAEPRIV